MHKFSILEKLIDYIDKQKFGADNYRPQVLQTIAKVHDCLNLPYVYQELQKSIKKLIDDERRRYGDDNIVYAELHVHMFRYNYYLNLQGTEQGYSLKLDRIPENLLNKQEKQHLQQLLSRAPKRSPIKQTILLPEGAEQPKQSNWLTKLLKSKSVKGKGQGKEETQSNEPAQNSKTDRSSRRRLTFTAEQVNEMGQEVNFRLEESGWRKKSVESGSRATGGFFIEPTDEKQDRGKSEIADGSSESTFSSPAPSPGSSDEE